MGTSFFGQASGVVESKFLVRKSGHPFFNIKRE